MQSVTLLGNFTVDLIKVRGLSYRCIGGPPTYESLSLRKIKNLNVQILGNYGKAHQYLIKYLKSKGIKVLGKQNRTVDSFELIGVKKKKLKIMKLGSPLFIEDFPESNYYIFNGVSNEIRLDFIKKAKEKGGVVYLDPQGFIRKRKTGKVELFFNAELSKYFEYIDYLKANLKELYFLTNTGNAFDGINFLLRKGVKNLILFENRTLHLVSDKTHYKLKVEKVRPFDGIGMGDLFASGFIYGLSVEGPELGLILGHLSSTKLAGNACILKAPDLSSLKDEAIGLKNDLKLF